MEILDQLIPILSTNYLVPGIVVIISLLVMKLLSVPFWLSLLLNTVPFLVLFVDLPIASEYRTSGYLCVVGGVWLLIVCFLMGRKIASVFSAAGSLVSVAFQICLWVAAGFAGMLYFSPEILDHYVVGWQQHAGLLLVVVTLMGATIAAISLLRVSIVMFFWLFVSFTIGSEIFLGKLPHEIFSVQVEQIFQGQSGTSVASIVHGFHEAIKLAESDQESGSIKHIVALGSNVTAGIPFGREYSFSAEAEKQIEKRVGVGQFRFFNLGYKNFSLGSARELLEHVWNRVSPDVVMLEVRAPENTMGLEPPPLEFEEESGYLHKMFSGRLAKLVSYLWASAMAVDDSQAAHAQLQMQLNDQSVEEIAMLVRDISARGARVLLVYNAENKSDRSANYQGFRDALNGLLSNKSVALLDFNEIFDREPGVQLFISPHIPSRIGIKLMGYEIARKIREIA